MIWTRLIAAVRKQPAAAAFGAGAVVFGLLSLPRVKAPSTAPDVPLVTRFVAKGSALRRSDIRWVAQTQLRPVSARRLTGYAKADLFPGEIVSPQELGSRGSQSVLVAVSPTSAQSASVAAAGTDVDVFVFGPSGLEWHSGPVPVLNKVATGGSSAVVEVAMTLPQALRF